MEILLDYSWVLGIVGIIALVGGLFLSKFTPKKPEPQPGEVQAQFVVTSTAGCMGCLVAISVIFGVIASIVSIVSGIYSIFK